MVCLALHQGSVDKDFPLAKVLVDGSDVILIAFTPGSCELALGFHILESGDDFFNHFAEFRANVCVEIKELVESSLHEYVQSFNLSLEAFISMSAKVSCGGHLKAA